MGVAEVVETLTVIPSPVGITAGINMIYVASFTFGKVYQFSPENANGMNDLVLVGDSAFEVAFG